MEGVTILETITNGKISSPGLWCITICCLAFACAISFDVYNSWKNKQYYYMIGLGGVVLASLFSITVAWCNNSFNEIKYVVTIDDSVNFNEFCEKYEIVSKSGDVYTVKEIG